MTTAPQTAACRHPGLPGASKRRGRRPPWTSGADPARRWPRPWSSGLGSYALVPWSGAPGVRTEVR
eukprot:1907746-Pyramimonas_sp.AAC.1